MRRLALLCVLALGSFVISHDVLRAQPGKQLICHVAGKSGKAHIIQVSVSAVPKHLQNHGDCLINSADSTLVSEPCDPTDANGNDICDIQP